MKKLFLLLIVLALVSCSKVEPSQTKMALGTVCTITLYNKGNAKLYNSLFKRVDEIGHTMTAVSNIQLGKVNQMAGLQPVAVDADVYEVIERALAFAKLSKGNFDPTIEPIVALWDIMGDNPKVPSKTQIEALLPLIDYTKVELDPLKHTVFLTEKGMALDLGAIAKGYAVDEVARMITQAGVDCAIVNFGGDIFLVGEKPTHQAWRVAIQDPDNKEGSLGIVETNSIALVTSGVYERFFEADGVRYHHIISPFTGYPSNNGLVSVSVMADTAINADGLSTGLFVMGYNQARALVDSLEGVEALFVFNDFTMKKTANFNFTLTHPNYTLIES